MSKYKIPSEQLKDSMMLLAQSQEEDLHIVRYRNMSFFVQETVFSPKYFKGWRTFTENFPSVAGKRVLEVGSGCGITSVSLAKQGAFVTALDVNPCAVGDTGANALLNGVYVEDTRLPELLNIGYVDARESDIYSALGPDEQFDYIYWNMPFIYVSEDYQFSSVLERALVDPGYKLTERFIRDANNHLTSEGKLLVGSGSFGDSTRLEEIANDYGYSPKIIAREESIEVNPVEFIFYELSRDSHE